MCIMALYLKICGVEVHLLGDNIRIKFMYSFENQCLQLVGFVSFFGKEIIKEC